MGHSFSSWIGTGHTLLLRRSQRCFNHNGRNPITETATLRIIDITTAHIGKVEEQEATVAELKQIQKVSAQAELTGRAP